MDRVLDAFSTRAAALFDTLPTRHTSPTFKLQVASREDLNAHQSSDIEHVEAIEPGPSPMTWSEVVEGSTRGPFDEGNLCELSVESRQAFEAEADYDEFDEVAVGSIQVGFESREKEELNKEIVEPDTETDHTRHRTKRVPRYLRYPQNYICYTLDTPVYVGGGHEEQTSPEEKESDRQHLEDAEMCGPHLKHRENETSNDKIAFRSQGRKGDVEMKTSLSSLPPCRRSVATEALRSFGESETDEADTVESAKDKDSEKPKPKRHYRKHRTQPSL